MGTQPQYRPKQLPTKLLQIRRALGLSQSELLRLLAADHSLSPARISEYESGTRNTIPFDFDGLRTRSTSPSRETYR
jgi:hypothetical protein